MKTHISLKICTVSCLSLIILFVVSCVKDNSLLIDDSNSERYKVTFKVADFDRFTSPLGFKSAASATFQKRASLSTSQSQVGYLYYWSFNQSSLDPDIALQAGHSISYNNGLIPAEYGAGFAFDTYAAGQALSFKGANDIIVKVSLKNAQTLSGIGFDLSSSGTGPKDFILSYSNDAGANYKVISAQNQFTNTNTSQAKNSFAYNIDTLSLNFNQDFYLKISLLSGQRGTASAYNEATGIMRLDNLHLLGTANVIVGSTVYDNFAYYIFNALTGELVVQGEMDFTSSTTEISESLPMGVYYTSFVSNKSDFKLLYPSNITHYENYYYANPFNNFKAVQFGKTDTLTVDQNISQNVKLKRLYSQIKFEFTDAKNLSEVKRIVINQDHEPFFYAPFNTARTNPIVDQSEIELKPDFSLSKQIVFNQFMGLLSGARPISYTIEVYSDVALLRTFTVSSAIKNNVQLVFRGNLLIDQSQTANFAISVNEDWDGEVITDF